MTMNSLAIKHDTHNALVLATAPLLMVVPFVLKFSPGIGLVSFMMGALIMAVALAGASPKRPLPMSAQSGFDLVLGISLLGIGIVSGLMTSNPSQTIFLIGFGAAHLALTASTRYSSRSA